MHSDFFKVPVAERLQIFQEGQKSIFTHSLQCVQTALDFACVILYEWIFGVLSDT